MLVESAPSGSPIMIPRSKARLSYVPDRNEMLLSTLMRTPCPYAAGAKGRIVDAAAPQSIGAYVSWLVAGTELAGPTDFVACEVPWIDACPSSPEFSAAIHDVLLGVVGAGRLYAGIETASWRLRTDDAELFPFVMSPGYATTHPRYLDWPAPVLVLQLEDSFTRHGITSRTSRRAALSTTAERRFELAGREYFGQITRTLPRSWRVIKPLTSNDPPIAWWPIPGY